MPESKYVLLRDVNESDIPSFYEHQRDEIANYMAAFTAKDPADKAAFTAKWAKILGDDSITKKTILYGEHIAGSVVTFVAPWSGKREVSYWIGREFWGNGIATMALSELLSSFATRPLYARVAKDNIGSIRVLEKCQFVITGYDKGFANARGEEVDEVILELKSEAPHVPALERVVDLSKAACESIRSLSLAVYPPEQFAEWAGRHVEWSTPEWCVRIPDEEGILVSFVGVYVREVECNGQRVWIGGIGNVKTHPRARRQGMAAQGIRRAIEFFRAQPCIAFTLLVCEPHLLSYYSRLGWREFGGRLLVRQRGTASEFTLNRVMTLGIRSDGPNAGTIDLCGPPW